MHLLFVVKNGSWDIYKLKHHLLRASLSELGHFDLEVSKAALLVGEYSLVKLQLSEVRDDILNTQDFSLGVNLNV